jgi:type I protein arginine methyltransferase
MQGVPYEQLWIHRLMLRDLVRGDIFREALKKVIHPDSVVLDIGAGSGILSLFAAQAGAKKVYAVERTSIVDLATKIVKANGYQEKIQLIQGDAEKVNLPEKADVIVSEWLGPFGVDENFLAPVIQARDRWLKPGGYMLPETATAWIAPVWDARLDGEMVFWQTLPYGFDLSFIADHTADEIRYKQEHVTTQALRSIPEALWTNDVRTITVEEAQGPFRAKRRFTFERPAQMNGFALWFSATFPFDLELSCAPGRPETHWARTICPLRNVLFAGPDTPIEVEFECRAGQPPGTTTSRWSVWRGGSLWEDHDTEKALY